MENKNSHGINNTDIPNNLAVFICSHIFDQSKPVLLVIKENDEWQFLCGGLHDEDELPKVVGVGHLLVNDKSLYQILDLENNWEAERNSIGSEWLKRKIDS